MLFSSLRKHTIWLLLTRGSVRSEGRVNIGSQAKAFQAVTKFQHKNPKNSRTPLCGRPPLRTSRYYGRVFFVPGGKTLTFSQCGQNGNFFLAQSTDSVIEIQLVNIMKATVINCELKWTWTFPLIKVKKEKTFTCIDSNLVPRVLVPTERNRASGGRERERLERRLQLTAVDSYMLYSTPYRTSCKRQFQETFVIKRVMHRTVLIK